MMTAEEREEYMVDRYGEAVTRTQAGKILGVSARTVDRRVTEGKLESVCGGVMIDVHSIAAYISEPAEQKRRERTTRRTGSRYAI